MTRRLVGALVISAVPYVALASTPATAELARESAVFLAVFQQQIREHLAATERARGTVLCIAIDPGGAPQSPDRQFMARLASEPSIRQAGEGAPRPEGGVEA